MVLLVDIDGIVGQDMVLYINYSKPCRNYIGGVMVSMLTSNVMVSMLTSNVMVSMLTSNAVDCGFEPQSGQTKNYKIANCCLSAKHAALCSKIKN